MKRTGGFTSSRHKVLEASFYYFIFSTLVQSLKDIRTQNKKPQSYFSLQHFLYSTSVSHVQLSATPWTVVCQAPLSMGFSRQKFWSRLPLASPGHLPDLGIEPRCPALQADSLLSQPPGKPILHITSSQIEFIFLFIRIQHFFCSVLSYQGNR